MVSVPPPEAHSRNLSRSGVWMETLMFGKDFVVAVNSGLHLLAARRREPPGLDMLIR